MSWADRECSPKAVWHWSILTMVCPWPTWQPTDNLNWCSGIVCVRNLPSFTVRAQAMLSSVRWSCHRKIYCIWKYINISDVLSSPWQGHSTSIIACRSLVHKARAATRKGFSVAMQTPEERPSQHIFMKSQIAMRAVPMREICCLCSSCSKIQKKM